MSTDVDSVIAALRSVSEELAAMVRGLDREALSRPSAATEWTIAQVLSHLGSGAEITAAGLEAALSAEPRPGRAANEEVWARWDARSPEDQAAGFLAANAGLLARYDALDERTRESLNVDLGFLPGPVGLAVAARFRLNELTLHSWDVRAALDPAAVLNADATPLLLDIVGLMLGWLAKPAVLLGRSLAVRVDLTDPERSFTLTLADPPALGDVVDEPDATVRLPAETWLRLVSGRLRPEHRREAVALTGDLGLDTLRQVFPGF